MMGWDGYLKNEIVRAIRKELERSNEMADEVWLTEKQLAKEMPFFKKSWLKHKGYKLHPRFAWVTDKKGEYHYSKKYYPRNAILKQLRESTITDGDLGGNIYHYRLKGGKVEVGGFDLFSNKWEEGLSINEIIYHL